MSDPKRRISVDHDSVTTNFTEQDEAPITPRTANSTAIQQDRQQTFDDLPSAPLPLLYSLGSPITPAFQKGDQVEQDTSIQHPKMTAPINVSPTAVGVVNGVRAPEYQQPHGFQAYPYAMPQAKEMHMSGAPMAGYRRDSRFDPMVKDGEVEDDGGYGELGQRHPLRRVQEEEREDGVSLPSIRNLFSVAGMCVQLAPPERPADIQAKRREHCPSMANLRRLPLATPRQCHPRPPCKMRARDTRDQPFRPYPMRNSAGGTGQSMTAAAANPLRGHSATCLSDPTRSPTLGL